MVQQIHANVFHWTNVPITYDTKIPADMAIEGSDPITPRVLESVHSVTLNDVPRNTLKHHKYNKDNWNNYIDLSRW